MNIQIFGKSKSFDTKKAERYFKERTKGLSKGELNSVLAAVGDIDKLIDPKAKGEQAMLIKYLGSTEEKIEKLLDYPELFAAPIVRNGKKATVGFCPEVWKSWE